MNIEEIRAQVKKANKSIKVNTINECMQAVDKYYQELADRVPYDITCEQVDMFILKPNRELKRMLDLMKGG